MGAGARACRSRPMRSSRDRARTTRRLHVEVAVDGLEPADGRRAARARRPRRPPAAALLTREGVLRTRTSERADLRGADDALRLRRGDRRAQRRQVDAGQPLVGSKVSIVTQKVQTTRFPVRGVAMEGEAQIVLVDTPGIFTPRRRLDRAMVRAAWGGAEDADVVCTAGRRRARASTRRSRRDPRPASRELKRRRKASWRSTRSTWSQREHLLALPATLDAERLRRGVHDLGAERRRRRRPARRAGRADAGGALALSRGPDRRPARARCSPPRSPARSSICGCTRSCPTRPAVETTARRSARTARRASSRPSMSSATASGRSCSARAARP